MTRELICVSCPLGCRLSVELNEKNEVLNVSGNSCKRGESYARSECARPMRSLTTTVSVSSSELPVVPVRSSVAVPKALIFDIMKEIKKIRLEAPVEAGTMLIKNVLGTGADICTTDSAKLCEKCTKHS